MRVSFNQPAFIPWGGFFGRLLNSDLMILLDKTQFARGFTFVNRNRLKGPLGEIWVTVPIKKKGLGLQKINQLQIHQSEILARRFLAILRHYYSNSLYLKPAYNKLVSLFTEAGDDFLKLAEGSIDLLAKIFGLKTPVKFQPEAEMELQGTDLLVNLALGVGAREVLLPYLADRHLNIATFSKAGLKVVFLKYHQNPYPQFWGNFLGNLSAL
ncbi:MAG: WbqC family protein, partial [Candidatus Saccharicenans sp.]|nr:WbqC family protein [Candidatus Saccharicenans sp.]